MTPTTPPISLSDVMNELRVATPGRAYPIALGDADVRALAGIASGPISLTNLLGKSSTTPMVLTPFNAYDFENTSGGDRLVSCSPHLDVAGGTGPFNYLWSITSSANGPVLSDPTAQYCTVSKNVNQFTSGTASATLSCTVTDSLGQVAVASNILADLEWENVL